MRRPELDAERRKKNEESLNRYILFADKVAHLSDEGWRRLAASCADLNSTSFGALVARAHLAATSQAVVFPDIVQRKLTFKAISVVGNAFMHTLWFG
jgi:hypothetical protein